MKYLTRLTALLLCAALLFGMLGCTAEPKPTEGPSEAPTEAPTEPSVSSRYDESERNLDLTITVNSTTVTTVADQSFTQSSTQTIAYSGFGGSSMKYHSTETVTYDKDLSYVYEETYIDGVLYTTVDDTHHFRSEMAPEEAAQRFMNPMMLDEFFNDSVTAGSSEHRTPQTLSYNYAYESGPADVLLTVEASVTYGPTAVEAPAEAEGYTALEDMDALYLAINGWSMLQQSGSTTASSMESIVSNAAGVIRNQSVSVDQWTNVKKKSFDAKVVTNVYLMNRSTGQSEQLEQEELYVDGKFTIAIDGEKPETKWNKTKESINNYCKDLGSANMADIAYWENAAVTDLGSLLLIELELSDEYADNVENAICSTLWDDGQFLRDRASAYKTNAIQGYIAIDKFTGLPTAAGYSFEGTHTIDGIGYTLTMQSDQSIDGASLSAYYNIRDELPKEEKPETQATPLFYHVTGDKGQEMWLLGTIHVGDERTGYLPKEIYDAFEASDALALEFDSEKFEAEIESDPNLQSEVSTAYYYSDGTQTSFHVDKEIYDEALQYLKATGNYNMNAPYMKPSLWSDFIENFYMRQGYRLTGEQGMEARLTALAHEEEKEILDVESGIFQVRLLTGWSKALHAQLLEDALDTDSLEYNQSLMELYELWCAGDEEALREALRSTVDTSELTEEEKAEYEEQKPLIDEYNKAMSYDRNTAMLKVAKEYLESGDVVFYAVGLAHLLDDVNGLVDALRDAGYTVELVEYSGK